ncbi:hypothetical protein KFL_003980070 [Klebsormidium nitens]|uniref:Uncharacterized protein n=1 Tax=Klebsormidium nitens TaxID=105231 RepID=A0A1Y1IDN6_KLENI|nr:hypothetical protein KFL_003980070 [Klebsormidium nitens]|eukprot:GAQ88072.1 hypothetical protein KFL_003980070 [Klebsormidium nitens]
MGLVNSPLQKRLFKKDSSRAALSSAAAASTVAAPAAEPPETNQALKESKGKADKKLKDDSKKDRFVWTIEEDKVYSQYLHEQIRQNNTSLPYTASSPFFERAVVDLLQDSVLAAKLKAYEEACPHGKDRVKWVAQKLGDKYKSYERRFKALEAKLNKSGNGVGFEDEDDLCEKEGPELDNQSTPASATEGTAEALEAEPSASAKPKPRNKSTNWPFKSAEERRLYEEYWLDLWGATAAVIQPNRKNARAEASSAKGKAAAAGGTAEGSADVSGAERTTRDTDDARGIKKAGKAAGGRWRNSKEEEEDSGDDEDGPGLFSFMRWQKNFQEEGLRRRAEAEGASARLLEKAVSATQDLGHTIKTATAQGNALQIMTLASLTGRSPQEMALSMSDLSSLFMGQFNHQDPTRGAPSAQQPQGPANDTN